MLPRSKRLTSLSKRIDRYDKIVHGEFFVLKFKPWSQRPLFSIQIAKHVAKMAHDRNAVKRLVYDILKTVNYENISSGAYLYTAKSSVIGKTREILKQDIFLLIDKLSKDKK